MLFNKALLKINILKYNLLYKIKFIITIKPLITYIFNYDYNLGITILISSTTSAIIFCFINISNNILNSNNNILWIIFSNVMFMLFIYIIITIGCYFFIFIIISIMEKYILYCYNTNENIFNEV